MTAKLVATLSLVAALGWTSPPLAAGSKEAGQAKSATCSACHGMDGNSANPEWPNLAGQHEVYIVRQLKAFRAGERQNVLMSPMAAILSDEDIADLAAYFSSQTVRGGEADPSKFGGPARLPLRQGQRAGHGLRRLSRPGRPGQRAGGITRPSRASMPPTWPRSCAPTSRRARTTDPNQMMRNIAALAVRGGDRRGRFLHPGPALNPRRASRVSVRHEQQTHRPRPVAARGRPAAGCRARRLVRRTRRRQATTSCSSPPSPARPRRARSSVVEVFWYACGHCYLLEPKLEAWNRKGRAPYVQLVRMPATWNPVLKMHARVFYTIELLGKPQLHDEVFREINVQAATGWTRPRRSRRSSSPVA